MAHCDTDWSRSHPPHQLPTLRVDGPTHPAPDIKDCFGLTAVMGRMFTSGSNAQIVNFAKSKANGNIGNVPGPKRPLGKTGVSALQLPRSRHLPRSLKIRYFHK